jgi:galactose mutarotase-like enzyme
MKSTPMNTSLYTTILSVTIATSAIGADTYRQTLSSVRENLRIPSMELHGKSVTPSAPNWSVTKSTLHGGKQEGVEVITVDNGTLRFTVIPTRGMSIHRVEHSKLLLAWNSPVKEIVHPSFVNLYGRGGLGWLEGFNEWMVRCGLESNGHPGTDRIPKDDGTEATLDLTLHGKIGNIPASEVELVIDQTPPHRIRIRGRVDERMFYGPQLELQTEISTEPGSTAFRISDTVTNRGGAPQEFEILYHGNYGSPLLEAGAKFVAPVSKVIPFNDHAAASIPSYDTFAAPTQGFAEQVYCMIPIADATGKTETLLHNKAADRGVSMQFSPKELPYLTLWKNTAADGEGYVTGIEPGTNFPNNRRIERKLGRVPKLAPGASHSATLDFTLLTDAAEVESAKKRIAAIQSKIKATLESRPEKKD